jgi:HK97 family phage prohead protease
MTMTHELKIFSGELKDLDEKGLVTFYFNSFNNVDSDKDMSMPGSFTKTMTDQKGRIKHFKNHNIYQSPGVIKSMGEDQKGAWAQSQLIMGTQLGRDTYEEYKAGAITEHSFGYDVIRSLKNPSGYREITEYKLWEVSSLNAWGANSDTPMIDIKDEKQLLIQFDLLLKLSKGDFTDEYLNKIELKINEIIKHIKTLRDTTLEPEPEPFDAMKYLQTNLKLLS